MANNDNNGKQVIAYLYYNNVPLIEKLYTDPVSYIVLSAFGGSNFL